MISRKHSLSKYIAQHVQTLPDLSINSINATRHTPHTTFANGLLIEPVFQASYQNAVAEALCEFPMKNLMLLPVDSARVLRQIRHKKAARPTI